MIEYIHIKGFKTLLDAGFPLGALNVFSGLNGMGKSTLIQSLLLLRQSYEQNTLVNPGGFLINSGGELCWDEQKILGNQGLLLNGEYINIGIGQDALSSASEQENIQFTLKWSELTDATQFIFGYRNDSDFLPLQQSNMKPETGMGGLSLFNTNFQYLSADRLGPESHHQLSEFHIRERKSLGQHGEYTVHFIAKEGAKPIQINAFQHPKAIASTLLANIEAWMSAITPGLKIVATVYSQLNFASLSYAFQQGKEITGEFKPQNVGFGLSYVLPVVTSILSAAKGDLLIIENPESHLHPAGQAVMGKLCAIAAHSGVQLIVESHSDHFLNGIRVAAKQQIIDAQRVKIFFLQRDLHSPTHTSEVLCPHLDQEGRIDCWPTGFFDEWDNQLDRLL